MRRLILIKYMFVRLISLSKFNSWRVTLICNFGWFEISIRKSKSKVLSTKCSDVGLMKLTSLPSELCFSRSSWICLRSGSHRILIGMPGYFLNKTRKWESISFLNSMLR